MRLIKFEVKNYRSIKKAEVSDIGEILVLIGANNEGKSNLLRAVRIALSAMENLQYFRVRGESLRVSQRALASKERLDYIWERDFPVGLQNHARLKDKSTRIRLTFRLSEEEIGEFREAFGLNVNGIIPVELRFSKDELEVDIIKQGPQKAAFKKKRVKIARFLSERLRFVFVPPVRTARVALEIVNRVIRNRVRAIQLPHLKRIEAELLRAEREAFDGLSEELQETLKSFIPDISGVKINNYRRAAARSEIGDYEVLINDGHLTPIEQKGDGVQSLLSLALMSSGTKNNSSEIGSIFAVEEPEAHLNSEAIYKLKAELMTSGQGNQVILTTHSPIFALAGNLAANIIVKDSQASPAKSISEIRDTLGVRVPENLTTAGAFVLVEGPSDKLFLEECFHSDAELHQLINDGFLRVESLTGAGNLQHSSRHYSQLSCEVFAFLDGDQEGRSAASTAISSGFLRTDRVRHTASNQRAQSELEDMFQIGEYEGPLQQRGLVADDQCVNHGGKWSVRMQNLAGRTGAAWDAAIKEDLKLEISQHLLGRYWEALTPEGQASVQVLISQIKKDLT